MYTIAIFILGCVPSYRVIQQLVSIDVPEPLFGVVHYVNGQTGFIIAQIWLVERRDLRQLIDGLPLGVSDPGACLYAPGSDLCISLQFLCHLLLVQSLIKHHRWVENVIFLL